MKNLKQLRSDAGLTQNELARTARIERWKVAHAEVGLRPLNEDEEKAIRRALVVAVRVKTARLQKFAGVA